MKTLNGDNFPILFDAHQEMLDDYVFSFLEQEQEILAGKRDVFSEVYAPVLHRQGVKFVNLVIGGDHAPQILYSASEDRYWDALKKLDMLLTEEEQESTAFYICRSAKDIEKVLSSNRIGLFLTIAGGAPLQGKKNLNLLANLRILYRCGLRGLQLTGNGRNRLGDGAAQERTGGRLTSFGTAVVKEADRLGMLLDTAQLSDHGFYDVLEITQAPVIDSHSCAKAICPHPGNISDDRIRAIAERGGVVGVSFLAALVSSEKIAPDVEDLFRHIDHIAEIAGIEHIALGPGYSAYKTPTARELLQGYANRGPDYCQFDRLTPFQNEKYPGIVDGLEYGIRKSDYLADLGSQEAFSSIAGHMRIHGYTPLDIANICGRNLLRIYNTILCKEEYL